MSDDIEDLPAPIRFLAQKIIHDIEHAGSTIVAVRNGAKAEGFVLGISCCHGLPQDRCDRLSAIFDEMLEKRLRTLTHGLF